MTVNAQKETLGFEAEVKQLLDLMVHSLYSNKEIFLRELISNASDAADKLRFEALSNDALYEGDGDIKIRVRVNKDGRAISVSDNGIGMDRAEVISNLGTIAKSGTREFFKALTGDQARDTQLIGEFGVGFYSSFIVADRVTVTTRRAGMRPDEGVRWESGGEGDYTIANVEKMSRGTEVVLHLRDGEDEFLEDYRLRGIIHKYSDHIAWPILVVKDKKKGDEEQINAATALWARARNEIKPEEYEEFYKHIAHDFEAPLAHVHSQVEGTLEYTSLLFIPKKAPFDLWDRTTRRGVKLYVRRVFIMDDAEQLMPAYLRFVRGVIDSNDLPLNISREILQQNRQIDSMRAGSVKKVLGLLDEMAKNEPEKYASFWKEFGKVLKEGIIEDQKSRDALAKLLRFASTRTESGEQAVSLDEYVGRMQEGQDKIYYITADNYAKAVSSPHLEVFNKKNIEVLLLTDEIDEWVATHLTEYQGKQLQSVTKGELDLGKLEDTQEKEKTEKAGSEYKTLLTRLKEALGDQVKEVRLTHRLTSSPACLVADEQDMGAHLERLLKSIGQKIGGSRPIMELNPDHPLVQRLDAEKDDTRFADWAHILFDQALLSEGGQPEDPAAFVRRLNELWMTLAGQSQPTAG
jgi:molecular chaperone HtpG